MAFLVGLTLLPFLTLDYGLGRAGLDSTTGVGVANPNDLAAWFGFCALAFTIRGFESRRVSRRWGAWAVALFSLFILGLTVSRGPMAALAVALVIAFRKQLRHSFIPVLALVLVLGTALAFGLFDQVIAGYAERGLEDSGRLAVWPLALQRFFDSPTAGVGVSDIATPTPFGRARTPHKGLIFIALGAGAVPLVFFMAYWLSAFRGALRGTRAPGADSAYLLRCSHTRSWSC